MVKNIRFATVQDYLDCDNARLTSVWARKPNQARKPYSFNAKRWAQRNTPEYKQKLRDIQKKLWSDPEYRAKRLTQKNNPEYKKKISDINKKIWSDPKYKKKQSLAMKNSWTEERRKKHSMAIKKILEARWSNPEHKKKHIDRQKKLWSDPEYRAKKLAQRNTPEYKKMLSDCKRLKQKMKAAQ